MSTKRIIPCLDTKDGRVVKGIRFRELRDAGDPVEQAVIYQEEGADEMVFLDISASTEDRGTAIELVKRVSGVLTIPLTVGGGIRSLGDASALLRSGADKISVSTHAVRRPKLIEDIAKEHGSQRLVVAIDASERGDSWEVYTHGGTTPAGIDAIGWVSRVEELGAGEILLTSIDRDGTMAGYDVELTRRVSEVSDVPVIASGGAGSPEHICEVLTKGRADAALAASLFHFGLCSVREVKSYLLEKGVPVRV